jgi:hypothetical protein
MSREPIWEMESRHKKLSDRRRIMDVRTILVLSYIGNGEAEGKTA